MTVNLSPIIHYCHFISDTCCNHDSHKKDDPVPLFVENQNFQRFLFPWPLDDMGLVKKRKFLYEYASLTPQKFILLPFHATSVENLWQVCHCQTEEQEVQSLANNMFRTRLSTFDGTWPDFVVGNV